MHWEILRKCISERAKLHNFTEFYGKLPISRKTFHFAVRVTAVKSRNRLGLRYNVPPCPYATILRLLHRIPRPASQGNAMQNNARRHMASIPGGILTNRPTDCITNWGNDAPTLPIQSIHGIDVIHSRATVDGAIAHFAVSFVGLGMRNFLKIESRKQVVNLRVIRRLSQAT